MILAAALVLTATASGCASGTEHTLAEGGLQVDVRFGYPDARVVNVEVSRANLPQERDGTECAIMRDSLMLVANGLEGTLTETGGYYPDDNGCTPARLAVSFDPLPAIIDLVLDDGSARLLVTIAKDSQQKYQVTTCEFDECSVF